MRAFATDDPILGFASHSPTFVAPENFPTNYECKDSRISLGVKVLHTPGHTPDELALWDAEERMLYVGDTLYEDDPIIFPTGGSLLEWFSTVDQLIVLVKTHPDVENVMINCGHATTRRPALEVLRTCRRFMENVVSGKEGVKKRWLRRGTWCLEFQEDNGRFSLVCPEKLVFDARV
ncbi:hypothetical protein M405DRAFT_852294 [Rhizopogon salebrosus TDB-379]|nr:hypothetical protein M405DRAFT_852294 [Rhizopogon salebrosus TDB-379]